jgi:hypothetical protein
MQLAIHAEFWQENFLENGEGDSRIILTSVIMM